MIPLSVTEPRQDTDQTTTYAARWGYRNLDARRYERRRYGGWLRRLNRRLLERALGRALADVPPGALVLDLPCGTGLIGRGLAARGFHVVGTDVSAAMLAVARERSGSLVRADVHALPYRPGVFQAIVSVRFLMHLPAALRPSVLAALAEVACGPLVATVSHPYNAKDLLRGLRRALGRPVKRSPRLTRDALRREAAAAGLTLEHTIPVMRLLSETWVVVLRRDPRRSLGSQS